jgi:2-polyprenyl-3-methyl-5-hydroxy-6-metoxy-1,4-benzoquinol methylase
MILTSKLVYQNEGNPLVIERLTASDKKILDIGCGAGDNARIIKSVYPLAKITGVTSSLSEYDIAKKNMDVCMCMDIEREHLPNIDEDEKFDVILFIHVLEHLVDPVTTIKKICVDSNYLKIGGKIIIALPNVANWRQRYKIAMGKFEYTDGGIMDKTHLHFYTFYTSPKYLINPIPELLLHEHTVKGSVPLGLLRHHYLTPRIRNLLDILGCRIMPNFFGGEIIMVAEYRGNINKLASDL